MRYTVTGRNIRIALLFRSFVLAGIITGGFAALAYTSDFIFPEVRPYLVGSVAMLTFFSRYATFLADKAMGAASLKLLSGSFLTLMFFSALSIAPLITEGRLYAGALEEVKVEGIEGADINGVAVGPGGRLMVTVSDDSQARLWDVHTGVGLGSFRAHENWVWQADVHPEGVQVVTASRDGTARIWSARGQEERLRLEGHLASVYDAKFSPSGDLVATASGDGTIKLWDAQSGEEIGTLAGHSDDVRSVAFSPDGRNLVSASRDGTVRVWSVERRAFSRTVGTGAPWNEVAWSRDTGHIAAVGDNGAVRVWTASGGRVMTAEVPGKAFGVAFTKNGERVAVGSIDGMVRLFGTSSGELIREWTAHQDGVRDVTADAEGGVIVTSSRDNTARVWSADTGEQLQIVGHITAAARLPFTLDMPPVAMASRAPVPMDVKTDRRALLLLAGKGLATAVAALVTGLLLKGLLVLTPVKGIARNVTPAVTGLAVLYYGALMLSALPVEATMLWATLLFGPAAFFAFIRWLLAASILKA